MSRRTRHVDDRTQAQLWLAAAFMGEASIEAVVDRAVQEYLARLRERVPGFAEAVDDARDYLDALSRSTASLEVHRAIRGVRKDLATYQSC